MRNKKIIGTRIIFMLSIVLSLVLFSQNTLALKCCVGTYNGDTFYLESNYCSTYDIAAILTNRYDEGSCPQARCRGIYGADAICIESAVTSYDSYADIKKMTEGVAGCMIDCNPKCGDGNLDYDLYEQCDFGSAVNTDAACSSTTYNQPCQTCDTKCQLHTMPATTRCGDGIVQNSTTTPAYPTATETCDEGDVYDYINNDWTMNTAWCYIPYGSFSCQYCDLSCHVKTLDNSVCGDGLKTGSEECDDGNVMANAIHNYDPSTPPAVLYGQSKPYCTKSCKNNISVGSNCGDGTISSNYGEQCDSGNVGTNKCSTFGLFLVTGATSPTCHNPTCKLDIISCEKIDWWTPTKGEWTTTAENKLKPINPVSTDPSKLISDPFDVLIGVDYELSAKVEELSSGTVTIKFNTTCYSIKGSEVDCNIPANALTFTVDETGPKSKTFKILTTDASKVHAMNGETYFRGVRLIVETTGVATISDISLKDIKPADIMYDQYPDALLTGCCPSNYCWDGKVCQDSSLWMDDASYVPIWNDLKIRSNNPMEVLLNNHVNTPNQMDANGYRCVIVNQTANLANWTYSKVKYDWNYEKSGYCAMESDCFIGYPAVSLKYLDSSKNCIHTGEIISDTYTPTTGNHYCHNGNWTTKSFIIATLLQNISKKDPTGDQRYTLSCYDDLNLIYNTWPTSGDEILSACVLTRPADDQIITGIVLADQGQTNNKAKNFIDSIVSNYKETYDLQDIPTLECLSSTAQFIDTGTTLSPNPNPQFTLCVDAKGKDVSGTEVTLKVYYNTRYEYFIVSNKIITAIESPPTLSLIWLSIKGFFIDIFTKDVYVTTYNSLNYTTSYDKLYILRGANGLNVTGIEESKYDEDEQKIVTVLYVKYSGRPENLVDYKNNPLSVDEVDEVIRDQLGDKIIETTYLPYNNNSAQEILIKSEYDTQTSGKMGIWQYFTTILRIDGSTLPAND